ncbi:Glyoxalase family protein [Rubellimicrobium mesophilum DSM 19309]|uniref:Glyoxalase family protein n=1 Tax=Rubellimicrobium mesophilum DSM 19309 TaxID=442562 RepID=A0A017HJE8_9RHOB|nr:Glyoxalase family protein [Rubellimicrobium mesophilum DSM 19309]
MRLQAVTLVVPSYDEGIAFFVEGLGWRLGSDEDQGGGKRWVVVEPPDGGSALLLARAVGPEQQAAIGRQAGGRVGFFLRTADFEGTAARLRTAGAWFEQEPRHEAYGTVAVWRDPWGNRWDLLGPP